MSWQIIGHQWAVNLLEAHVIKGEVRHAYLFTGPQGVGRRTLALRMAQALNCITPLSPGEACLECSQCTRIERMQHPDLEVIKAEREGGIIKVDQIRELQHRLSLAPYESNYRIAILQRFEEANESASNALLKTLEEPAPQVVLMLTSESVEQLLPTISSRCEVIRLRPVPLEIIKGSLQARFGVSEDHAILLTHLSVGCPGYAIRLHEQPEQLERRKTWLDEHYELLSSGRVTRFAYAYTISNDREKLRDLLHVLMSLWRDILHRSAGAKTPLFNPDRAFEIDQLASSLGLETARRVVAEIERTIDLLERNVNSRLAVEVLLMNIPQI